MRYYPSAKRLGRNLGVGQQALSLSLLLCLALAACQAQPIATVAVATDPPATASAIPSSTPATVSATLTSLPPATPSATGTRPPTATDTPTPNATQLVETVVAAATPQQARASVSPDGRWRAQVEIYACANVAGIDNFGFERMTLTEASTGQAEVVDTQLMYCGGLGAYGLKALFWSPNSRYFYYTPAREGQPDGLCGYWARPVIALEVASGKKTQLADGPRSPDGTMLAAWVDMDIVVWSLNEGEMGRAPLAVDGAILQGLAWAPDGHSLAYLLWSAYCFPVDKTYLVRLDRPTFKQTVLLETQTPTFSSLAWDAPNRIRLVDNAGGQWQYDVTRGAVGP